MEQTIAKKIVFYHIRSNKIENDEELKKKKIEILENSLLDRSSCIVSTKQMAQLMKLCNFPLEQKWHLLYRASENGFLAEDFHRKCDSFKCTLTIIKSKNANIFGGYTEEDWSGDLLYKNDSKASKLNLHKIIFAISELKFNFFNFSCKSD